MSKLLALDQASRITGYAIFDGDKLITYQEQCAISIEELMETGTTIDGELLYELADPRGDFEANLLTSIQMEQFKAKLPEADKQILQMRYDGYSLQEIADAVGFKTAGAVSKHIAKIAGSYEDFVSDQYDEFMDKHIN